METLNIPKFWGTWRIDNGISLQFGSIVFFFKFQGVQQFDSQMIIRILGTLLFCRDLELLISLNTDREPFPPRLPRNPTEDKLDFSSRWTINQSFTYPSSAQACSSNFFFAQAWPAEALALPVELALSQSRPTRDARRAS